MRFPSRTVGLCVIHLNRCKVSVEKGVHTCKVYIAKDYPMNKVYNVHIFDVNRVTKKILRICSAMEDIYLPAVDFQARGMI